MEEKLHIRRSEYEQLLSQIEELKETVRQLREEIALLKNGRNSKTSSTAPSQDINRSNTHSLRENSGKKSGGQPGHAGQTLSMSATPDQIIEHRSCQKVCPECGRVNTGIYPEGVKAPIQRNSEKGKGIAL
jgi:uncharacterized small protein (DUF1192 family)